MGAFFSLGVFVVYIIFGMGLFSILQDKFNAAMFRTVLAVVLLVLGLMQLEDARRLQSGGTSLFRTDWTKKFVHGVIASLRLQLLFPLRSALYAGKGTLCGRDLHRYHRHNLRPGISLVRSNLSDGL
jgi:hypothetical protein